MSRAEVHRLIDMRACIDAVEDAFRRHARGESIAPAVLGTHVDGGGFHMKTAGMLGQASGGRSMFVAKVNANFPHNGEHFGLPTIQGLVILHDGANGLPLAVLDSISLAQGAGWEERLVADE